MKEAYFTHKSLARQADRLLAAVRESVPMRSQPLVRERAALLVIDMQDYFLHPDSPAFLPAAPAIVATVQALVAAFADLGRPIIFTRHVDRPDSTNALWRWWHRRLLATDPLSRLTPDLDPGTAPVLTKHEYDAFHASDLQTRLAGQDVTQVVVCGVMTHLCCESTARAAFVRGFDVFFPVDATATTNLALHQSTLLSLAHGFATVGTAASLLAALRAEHAA